MAQVIDESPPVKEEEKKDDNEIGEVSEALDELNLQEDAVEGFPFLELPDDCIRHVYPFLDIASRRALRVNGRLEKIESGGKYRYSSMKVRMVNTGFSLSCDGSRYSITDLEVEKELELLGKNTYFDEVFYMTQFSMSSRVLSYDYSTYLSVKSIIQKSIEGLLFLGAKKVCVDSRANDRDLFDHIVNDHSDEELDYNDPDGVKERFFPSE